MRRATRAQMAIIEFGKIADMQLHAIGVVLRALTFNASPVSLAGERRSHGALKSDSCRA